MQRILVTGGAGFIGCNLCQLLVEAGRDVHCVDNFFTGSRANVLQLSEHPRFELMRHDVTFPLYLEVDKIYNLACPASPAHHQLDPVPTTKTSAHGAINMLGLAKRVRARVFQSSTSEVYGDPVVPRSSRATEAASIRSASARVLTKAIAEPKPCSPTTTASMPGNQGRPHLQHLRPAHAHQRRARAQQLHRLNPAGPLHYDLRRRIAGAQLLLRQ